MNGALKHLASCSYFSAVFQTNKGEENVGAVLKGFEQDLERRRAKFSEFLFLSFPWWWVKKKDLKIKFLEGSYFLETLPLSGFSCFKSKAAPLLATQK